MAKDDNSKACAILSYLFIGIIWYLADDSMKKSKFVKFHVKQAIILLITSIIISMVGTIIPFIGWFIILPLGQLLIIVLLIIGIVNAASDSKKELPIIGSYAKKLTF